jgi:hypothetical protein
LRTIIRGGHIVDKSLMTASFMEFLELWMWTSLSEDNMYRRNRRLVCFDMDSTLIQTGDWWIGWSGGRGRAGEAIRINMVGEKLQTTDGFTWRFEVKRAGLKIYPSRKGRIVWRPWNITDSRPLFCREVHLLWKYLQNWGSITFTLMNGNYRR